MSLGSVLKLGVRAILGRKNEKLVQPQPCLDPHFDLNWDEAVSCKIKHESPRTSLRGTTDKS